MLLIIPITLRRPLHILLGPAIVPSSLPPCRPTPSQSCWSPAQSLHPAGLAQSRRGPVGRRPTGDPARARQRHQHVCRERGQARRYVVGKGAAGLPSVLLNPPLPKCRSIQPQGRGGSVHLPEA